MNRDNFKWTDELVKDFFLDYRQKISSYPISQRIAEFKASHTSAIEDENDEYEGVSSKELKHIIRFWKKSNQSNYENWKEANYELRKLKNQISPASSAIEEREEKIVVNGIESWGKTWNADEEYIIVKTSNKVPEEFYPAIKSSIEAVFTPVVKSTNEPLPQRTKPPLGVMPRWLHNEKRLKELDDAIVRYTDDKKFVPIEWIVESYELREWLKNRESKKKLNIKG